MAKLLIVSVGGTPEPVLLSIEQQRPEYVIYVASVGSRRVVREEIEKRLTFGLKDHELLMVPDEQDLLGTVEMLLERVPPLMRQWQVPAEEVVADFTGGTKAMSAAVVLALSSRGVKFSYVGGSLRDKNGLGVVQEGSGAVLHLQNPWDVLSMEILPQLELLFNRCRFRTVAELAQRTTERTERHRAFFQALHLLADGFYYWDSFQYRRAIQPLRQGYGLLRPYTEGSGHPALLAFCAGVAACLDRLENVDRDTVLFKSTQSNKDLALAQEADGMALIKDLLANAVRRAEAEFKYEDAVARLYSAIEKLAKTRLKIAFGIDNSNVDPAKVSDPAIRADLEAARAASEGKLQLPLSRSYALLAALGDPLGAKYLERQVDLLKVLDVRNHSLLAHGFNPVGEDTYRNLLAIALDFTGCDAASIEGFPRLDFAGQPL